MFDGEVRLLPALPFRRKILKLCDNVILEIIKTLGLFRQVYQQLRKAIRDGALFESTYGTSDYTLFNDLAGKMTCIISSNKIRMCDTADAPSIIRKITAIRSEEWREEQTKKSLPTVKKGAS